MINKDQILRAIHITWIALTTPILVILGLCVVVYAITAEVSFWYRLLGIIPLGGIVGYGSLVHTLLGLHKEIAMGVITDKKIKLDFRILPILTAILLFCVAGSAISYLAASNFSEVSSGTRNWPIPFALLLPIFVVGNMIESLYKQVHPDANADTGTDVDADADTQ